MAPRRGTTRTAEHTLGLHHGEVLLRLSNTYPTITLTVVEAVQNAIDADAKKVFIGIDVKRRVVIVLDDGAGVTEAKFQEALLSVGKGIKRRGSLGRFGLGLISPLNKCVRYVFASHPLGAAQANVWTFEGEKIRGQHHEVKIPFEQASTLPPIPRQFAAEASGLYARWRTIVHLSDVTEDRVVGVADLDELEGQIRSKLGLGMRRTGTSVSVVIIDDQGTHERTIDPTDYNGSPLEVVSHTEPACGKVTFELYRAQKTGGVRRGEVVIMRTGDNYPITWREFVIQALGSRKLAHVREAFDVLGSGYFEGVIHAENIELAPERTAFRLGEALNSLYVAIYAWYLNRGKDLYEDEQEARREQRYQDLGQKSLRRILSLLDENTTFAAMARSLLGVLPDEQSDGDAAPKPRPHKEPEEKGEAKRRERRVVADPPTRQPRDARDTRPNLSLRFAYEMLTHSTRLWEFDTCTGVLTFNVRHPVWRKVDETDGKHTAKTDRQVMHLQEWLALKLLLLLAQHDEPDFDFEVARIPVDNEVRYYAEMFITTTK